MLHSLVSLFTGAGGLDIGLERSGFATIAANDVDKHACATLRENQSLRHDVLDVDGHYHYHLGGARIVEGDIRHLDPADLKPDDADPEWRPDALVGGPPCQSFSSAGSQRSLDDPRGQLFLDFVRLARELRPRIILFENVRGLVTARGPNGVPGEAVNLIRDSFEEIGYATSFRVLNAADYGAPQRRVRMFMFGAASDAVLPEFPAATHSREGVGTKPWVTLREFLSAYPEPEESEIIRPSAALRQQLENLSDGNGLRSPGRSEPTRPGGHWGYRQGTFIADLNLPARTVTGATTQDWIRRSGTGLRRITLHEAAAIQGFPDKWKFAGPRSAQFQQVGNAVPATFGEVLGATMISALREQASYSPVSAPFPHHMNAAISYTARDDMRNGVSRPRSPLFNSTGAPATLF